MNDTDSKVARMVAERHAAMTPEERFQAAAEMYEVAVSIVDSSLPVGLTERARRLERARRIYGDEMPDAALQAFADYQPPSPSGKLMPTVLKPPST